MNLDDALKSIAARWKCVDGLPLSVCQTGDTYMTVKSGGIFEPDSTIKSTPCGNPDAAIMQWFGHVMRYGLSRKGTLYWRIKPELEHETRDKAEVYQIYSRLVITDKPVIWPTLADWEESQEAAA